MNIEKLHASMVSMKQWMMQHLADFDWLLKQRKDLEYYQQQQARLEKRVELLEKKLLDS